MTENNKINRILTRICFYCDEIEALTQHFGRTLEIYSKDSAYRHACGMCILQIGELAAHLPAEFCKNHDNVPWKKIKGMRNIIAHDYDNTDISIVWATIEFSIPEIRLFCKRLLNETKTGKEQEL